MKRVVDVLISLLALSLLAPLMLIVAILIYLQDRGPILFRQSRVGRNERTFEIYKFRSMIVDADRGAYSTAKDDPRITPFGRVLRRTSLDELPQLLNVLKGEMSIVGPRPDVPSQQSLYSPEDWRLRTSVRPGLTGLAQATSRSAATPDERTAMDLSYARSSSFWLDMKIIVMTIKQIIVRTGV